MRIRATPWIFLLQLAVLSVAIMFVVSHWPYGRIILSISILLEVTFLAFAVIEIAISKSAAPLTKILFGVTYCLLVALEAFFAYRLAIIPWFFAVDIISGLLYLLVIRNKIAPPARINELVEFDSIQP